MISCLMIAWRSWPWGTANTTVDIYGKRQLKHSNKMQSLFKLIIKCTWTNDPRLVALRQIPKLSGNYAFQQNFHTRKLGEITVFHAMLVPFKKSWTPFTPNVSVTIFTSNGKCWLGKASLTFCQINTVMSTYTCKTLHWFK